MSEDADNDLLWPSIDVPEDCPAKILAPSRISKDWPGHINVAAVMEEQWVESKMAGTLEPAFHCGRLWNAMHWLREAAIIQQGTLSLVNEAQRVRRELRSHCGSFLQSFANGFSEIVDEDEREWRRFIGSPRHEHWIETLIEDPNVWRPMTDPEQAAELILKFAGCYDNSMRSTSLKLGIVVDQAARPFWSERGMSKRLHEVWCPKSSNLINAVTTDALREILNRLLGKLNDVKIPMSVSIDDLDEIDRGIRNELRSFSKMGDEEYGIHGLVFVGKNHTVSRRGYDSTITALGQRYFGVLKALSDAGGFLSHESTEKIWKSIAESVGESPGKYPDAFRVFKNKLNNRIRDLKIEIVSVRRKGWKLTSAPPRSLAER